MIYDKAYRLVDEDNMAIFEFKTDVDRYFNGELYQVISWIEDEPYDTLFVAEVNIKWDLCSHWNFYGEDYKKDDSINGYYHICGGTDYVRFMQGMAFVYELANMIIEEYDQEEYKVIKELNLLDGYKIIEVEQ